MNYLLFNNGVFISDGKVVSSIEKGPGLKESLGSLENTRLCCVDADVLIAASVEYPPEKKDSILVRKFKELYQHGDYIIQDEKIDNNLFQVIGIKEQKVREIYGLIPPDKVESFIPYGMALRNTLMGKNVDLNKTVVFVDDLGSERLLTVFDGLKFSRTRVIVNNGEDILPEIKRSQIDFFKKTEGFLNKKNTEFVIIINDQALVDEISKNTEKLQVEFLNVLYPALEGLKAADFPVKYTLPEENSRKRREIEFKKRMTASIISLCVVAVGLAFFMISKLELGMVNDQYGRAKRSQGLLDRQLQTLDRETYREDLRAQKSINYGVSYLSMLEMIPASYRVNSFRFYKTGKWNIEMTLFADDDGIFDPIPRTKILKNAEVKDIFINNQPGKLLRVVL